MDFEKNQKIKDELNKEMDRIRTLWEIYFLEHKLLKDSVWTPKNITFSYVGTILGNFIDTFDVIYDYKIASANEFNYASNMSLMQAIYIQQDIMEDLLLIFRTKINKGNLKLDENYNLNRNIRNELMGHPIRRDGAELISTTLIAYDGAKDCIKYMRYHKDNGFEFEVISHKIQEILERHSNFIKTYFNKIILQIKKLMKPFIRKLNEILIIIDSIEIPKLVNFIDQCFESVYRQDFCYGHLVEIDEKRAIHPRYQHFIDTFKLELKESITGHLKNIEEKFNPVEEIQQEFETISPLFETDENGSFKIIIADQDGDNLRNEAASKKRNSYSYEIGKLATNPHLFDMCYNTIKKGCSDNAIILEELEHMKINRFIDIEYYCALKMIRTELKYDEY